jgi:hypothetical protein
MTNLKEKLNKAICKDLEGRHSLSMRWYSRDNREVLNRLDNKGIIDAASLNNALESIISTQAKMEYSYLEKTGNIHGCAHLEMLSYAIEKKLLPERQLKSLSFSQGNNLSSFIDEFGQKDLITRMYNTLLNQEPSPMIESDFDEHPYDYCD